MLRTSRIAPWLYLTPLLLVLGFTFGYRLVAVFDFSLRRIRGASGPFIGLENYRQVLKDDIFHEAVAHNAVLLLAVPIMTSFANSFRQATGSTPHRFLRKARIERACELLRTTGLSVGDIAAVVGFRGQSHFCTAFLAERGLTPTRYRKAARRTVGRGHSLPKSSNICTRKRTPVAHRVATPKPINMENK